MVGCGCVGSRLEVPGGTEDNCSGSAGFEGGEVDSRRTDVAEARGEGQLLMSYSAVRLNIVVGSEEPGVRLAVDSLLADLGDRPEEVDVVAGGKYDLAMDLVDGSHLGVLETQVPDYLGDRPEEVDAADYTDNDLAMDLLDCCQ